MRRLQLSPGVPKLGWLHGDDLDGNKVLASVTVDQCLGPQGRTCRPGPPASLAEADGGMGGSCGGKGEEVGACKPGSQGGSGWVPEDPQQSASHPKTFLE